MPGLRGLSAVTLGIQNIVDKGGFVGVRMFPPFLPKGIASTIDDDVAAMDDVIDLAGEDSVGIGTDFTHGYDREFFDRITHDEGFGRRLTDFGAVVNPAGFRKISDFPTIAGAMERRGWSGRKIENVRGRDWIDLLDRVRSA